MHPILFRLGHLAIPTQGVFVALGLLLAIELASIVGKRLGIPSDRLWNLGLIMVAAYFFGERLMIIACNLRDFIAHPLWMLGLTAIQDERYIYSALALVAAAAFAYIAAWRLPWRRVLDAAAPGVAIAMACISLGALAAGSNPGRPTAPAWGIVYTNRIAGHLFGTPLGIPLVPVALYAAAIFTLIAGGAVCIALYRPEGEAAIFCAFTSGLATVLLAQLRYPTPGEFLIAKVFTPGQAAGVGVFLFGALWYLLRSSRFT